MQINQYVFEILCEVVAFVTAAVAAVISDSGVVRDEVCRLLMFILVFS